MKYPWFITAWLIAGTAAGILYGFAHDLRLSTTPAFIGGGVGLTIGFLRDVLYGLAQNRQSRLNATLLEAFKEEKNPEAAGAMAEALIRHGSYDPEVIRELVAAMEPGDCRDVATYHVLQLAVRNPQRELIKALTPILRHDDPEYRRRAADLLALTSPNDVR